MSNTHTIAHDKNFHPMWEKLQGKLGNVLNTAYNGSIDQYRDAVNSAMNSLEVLKTLCVTKEE